MPRAVRDAQRNEAKLAPDGLEIEHVPAGAKVVLGFLQRDQVRPDLGQHRGDP
ncbi:hypothetical protein ACFQY5_09445 [Paeniroseomonas aquatica]|uniref:hypothetical protein n=1 Tax=Paeniroseomonas aquatica TaxID=373043 RepID=UPI00360F3DB8